MHHKTQYMDFKVSSICNNHKSHNVYVIILQSNIQTDTQLKKILYSTEKTCRSYCTRPVVNKNINH